MELTPGFDPYVGAQIAGYRLEALVGRGGMSVVYRAEQQHLGRKVAVKLLAPELARDERFRQRFVRESRLAASLDHPNIIPIYDAGEAEGLLYIAMRFVEGCTLSEYIERHGPLLPSVALSIVDQIGAALDVAHAAGLVHRDVKPENILITEKQGELDRIFLSDFGLTKRPNAASTTRSGELMGTVGYVAPEQIEGKPLDGRSDVYSLGCVLYECLTGSRPFDQESDVATLWAHLNQPVPRITRERSELPAAMDAVVATALAKDPGARFETAGMLAATARHAFETETTPRTLTRSLEYSHHRRGRTLWILALSVIALVGVAVVVSRQLVSAPPRQPTTSEKELGVRLSTGAAINRSPTSRLYRNPIVVHNAPDPAIIAAGGMFYAYTTQSVYSHLRHLPVLVSRNLIEWRFLRDGLPMLPEWADTARPDTWGPDAVHVNGRYYIYFAERLKPEGSMGIALATSKSPRGPFRVFKKPLLSESGFRDIDPFVLTRPNGRLVLYWGSPNGLPIRAQKLSKDGKSLVGAKRSVLPPSTATSFDDAVEVGAVVRHEGFYFLFYSGDHCCGKDAHYAVLVARSRSPMGPFQRTTANPVIASNRYFDAPGHGSVFRDGSGAYFILYQAIERSDPTRLRYLMLDRIRWLKGWPVVNGGRGPSHRLRLRPKVPA
ncbi:MAG: family 43 glycosylhydrolase [Actinomycetota bacterium]|nr:family 43 glycosylhydrolase [Actinomycetota bacterium]